MRRVRWRVIWAVCWALFLVADRFADFTGRLSALLMGAEQQEPGVFYYRLQTGLLVGFVVVALAPLLWPLARRWLVVGEPAKPQAVARDPRDASLSEALGYLANRSAWGAARTGGGDAALQEAADLLEEAAKKGRIELRGVPEGGGELVPVAAEYWLTAAIDVPATIEAGSAGGQSVPREAPAKARKAKCVPLYHGLVVDRSALTRLWPPDNIWRSSGRAMVRGVAGSLKRPRAPEKPQP